MLPDGHVVIFSNTSDWAHTVTPLAAIAWEYCDGQHSIKEIVECVKQFVNSDFDNLEATITELMQEFAQSGLVSLRN